MVARGKTEEVRIPDGPWLTLREGAAYARMSYPNFTQAVKHGDIRSFSVPGYSRTRRVRKEDIDAWLRSVG